MSKADAQEQQQQIYKRNKRFLSAVKGILTHTTSSNREK